MSEPADSLSFPSTDARLETLGNGLEIIVLEDHDAPVVSVQAWCRAGSIHEGPLLGSGASHFVEHMLFKGTERREATRIAAEVQEAGGYINAYTSFDRTVYWIDAPSEGADVCLDVLCDVIGFSQLPEDEFAREADVIRREIAMGEDNPDRVVNRLLFSTAYANHPCRYPVIGHLDLFNQLSREDLAAYYREKYSPDQMFFVIAGDVDADGTIARIEDRLGPLERRRRSPVVLPEEPRLSGIRRNTTGFPTDLQRSRIAWPVPDGSHGDVPALDLMVAILGDGRSSRLYRTIREERRLAHSVGAYAYTPSFSGQVVIACDTEPESAGKAEEAIFAEVERIREAGVDEAELARVKRQALSEQFSTQTDMRGKASDLASNWLLTRNLDYTRDYVASIERVDREAVARVAREYLPSDIHSHVVLAPMEAVSRRARPTAASRRSEDVRRVELENGLTVLLLSDRRVPFVHAAGMFRGGLLAETESNNGITRLMARLLVKDTGHRSAAEVAEAIESVGGGISSSIGNNTFGASVHALRPDLDLVVDLLAESLASPAFVESALDRERGFQVAQIKGERDRPFRVAFNRLRRELFGNHPYGLEPSGTEEALAGLTRDDVVEHHHRLVRGGNGVVGLFGDLDLDAGESRIREAFSKALADGPRLFDAEGEPAFPEITGETAELEHEKQQAVVAIGYRTVDLTHPDHPALEMIDEACSDMASRLFIRIREELGLAYSVGATRMIGLQSGMIVFYASTAPEKLDRVQEEMLAEIELMRREGLAPGELARAKASWLGREAIQLQAVRELAVSATVDELVGLGWDHYRRAPDVIRGLGEDAIREAAERYLAPESAVVVRLTRGESAPT